MTLSNVETPAVEIGLEVCRRQTPPELAGRIGLLANQGSLDHQFQFAWDVVADLAEQSGGQLAAIFSPQHGLWGCEQANMIESPHSMFPQLGVPVYSLYSQTRKPTPEMLSGLDALVVDLQDVGTRVYTFIWTVTYCLEACANAGLPLVVLDRPNPLGGLTVEGGVVQHDYTSFVGRTAIPMRHSLTIGEIALVLNQQMQIGADLRVIPLGGWRPTMQFPQTGRRWFPPSPNMPRFSTALVYPGQVLLEGTNLSEGRGLTTPFEVCGSPYIDPHQWLDAVEKFELPGVRLTPLFFRPTFDKWAGQNCGGLFLHVTDEIAFRPYLTTVALLAAAHRLWPDSFDWTPPPYEYETQKMPIDILSGSARLREAIATDQISTAADLTQFVHSEQKSAHPWRARTQTNQLYPRW